MEAKDQLKLTGISKTFPGQGEPAPVLEEISLTVGKGEFVTLIGPSGSGKSTLFHIIGGLERPTSGHVFLGGKEITGAKGYISYMPQNHALLPWRTIEGNVIMAQEVAGVPKAEALRKAREWLPKVGLEGYERAYPSVLSGGMQQRASFLRALLSPQELMCLDEPFGSLDALTRQEMQDWLLRMWEANQRSVLFVTHSIDEALFLSDRIYLLSGKPTVVLKEINVPFSRPREEGVVHSVDFIRLKEEIYGLMKKEQERSRRGKQ